MRSRRVLLYMQHKEWKTFIRTFWFVILLFFVTGCNSTSHLQTPALSTADIEVTVFPSLAQIKASETPLMTLFTATPTLSLARATQESLRADFSSICQNPHLYNMVLSPNGKWVVVECYDNQGPYIKIVRIDRQIEWEFYYLDIYGSKQESIDGHFDVSHWTQDGNYVYITTFPQMDGGDGGYAFFEAAALYRLDLNSGELTETLPGGNAGRKYYSLGFSPNDRRLAYFNLSSQFVSLVIHDFQTGDDQFVSLDSKYNTGGEFIWADNSKLLVFCAAYFDINVHSYSTSTIFLWDNEQKTLQKLVDNFEEVLVPIKWSGEAKITLKERFSMDETEYDFDLGTQTLTPVR